MRLCDFGALSRGRFQPSLALKALRVPHEEFSGCKLAFCSGDLENHLHKVEEYMHENEAIRPFGVFSPVFYSVFRVKVAFPLENVVFFGV